MGEMILTGQVMPRHEWHRGGSRDITLLVLNLSTRWECVVNTMCQPLDPMKEMQYPLYIRLGGTQG